MICDKDGYICHFTSGLSIDLGIFPKLFMHPGAASNQLNSGAGSTQQGTREIKVDDLSLDFANKESELQNDGGSYINLTTLKLVEKVERENISQEEYAYFLSKQSNDFKLFCQLIYLSYGNNLAEVKLYRMIMINNQGNGAGGLRNSPSLEAIKNAQERQNAENNHPALL